MVQYATEGVSIGSVDVPGGGDAWANYSKLQYPSRIILALQSRAKCNYPDGIHIDVGAEIKNNRIVNNVEEGIFVRNWCGYQSILTNPLIVNNVIQYNETGIYLRANSWWLGHVDERTTIRNNIISNNATNGILVEANGSSDTSGSDTDAKATIENNLLFGNETNIYLNLIPQGSDGIQVFQPTIRFNTFSDATVGIVIAETEPYDTYEPIIDHNVFESFDGVSSQAVVNQSSRIVYVNDSYWGSNPTEWDAGMTSDAVTGAVFSNSFMDSSAPPLITVLSPGTAESGEHILIYGANLGSLPQQFLPIVLNQAYFGMEPIFIGHAIPQRDVQTYRETFYSTTIQIPQELPANGNFYLSAQSTTISPVLVDDEIVFKMNNSIIFTHDFSAGGIPQSTSLIFPRSLMEQVKGEELTVEYLDVYGNFVMASDMWLIWAP